MRFVQGLFGLVFAGTAIGLATISLLPQASELRPISSTRIATPRPTIKAPLQRSAAFASPTKANSVPTDEPSLICRTIEGERRHSTYTASWSLLEDGGQPNPQPPAPRRVLFIRVQFTDSPLELTSVEQVAEVMTRVDAFMQANSYGKVSLSTTATPTFRLTPPAADDPDRLKTITERAESAATSAGYDPAAFDHQIVFMPLMGFDWLGSGEIGGRKVWIQSAARKIPLDALIDHEMGHNLGLLHARRWHASNGSVIGPGEELEYGDIYDVMGDGIGHYNNKYKRQLGWIDDAAVPKVDRPGIYRIWNIEGPWRGPVGLRISKDAKREYWIEYRPLRSGTSERLHGALVRMGFTDTNNTNLLFFGPEDIAFFHEQNALLVGRTYSDTSSGIHITPLRESDEGALDVAIEFGAPPSNHAPVVRLETTATSASLNSTVLVSAHAEDPDGDALAFDWTITPFRKADVPINAPRISLSFDLGGYYVVTCRVSDLKGGVTTDGLVISVGSPFAGLVGGHVTLEGRPIEGARVYASMGGQDFSFATSRSDGSYFLPLLPGSWNLRATRFDMTISGPTEPVPFTSGRTDIDFAAKVNLHSILVFVTSPQARAEPGVELDGAGQSVITDANGFAWLKDLPNGMYPVKATKPGYILTALSPNPVEVYGGPGGIVFEARPDRRQ